MFLIVNIPRDLTTALGFHLLKWLLIYGSKHAKYWFSHIVHCNFTTMVFTEINLWFLSSLEYFLSDPLDTLSKVALLFRETHKVVKNKVQGCSNPLKVETCANFEIFLLLFERELKGQIPFQVSPRTPQMQFSLAQSARTRTLESFQFGCIDRPCSSPSWSQVCENCIFYIKGCKLLKLGLRQNNVRLQ